MHKKVLPFFGFIILLLASSLIFLRSSAQEEEYPKCCKRPNNKCIYEEKSKAPEGMIIESLSRQFIGIKLFSY